MTSMSRRPCSRWNLSAKLITEAKSARSTVHGSHDVNPVAASISRRDKYQEEACDAKRTGDGSFTLALVSTSDDKLCGPHTREMLRGFEPNASVSTDHDDGFSRQIRTLHGRHSGPLVDDETEKRLLHCLKCMSFGMMLIDRTALAWAFYGRRGADVPNGYDIGANNTVMTGTLMDLLCYTGSSEATWVT